MLFLLLLLLFFLLFLFCFWFVFGLFLVCFGPFFCLHGRPLNSHAIGNSGIRCERHCRTYSILVGVGWKFRWNWNTTNPESNSFNTIRKVNQYQGGRPCEALGTPRWRDSTDVLRPLVGKRFEVFPKERKPFPSLVSVMNEVGFPSMQCSWSLLVEHLIRLGTSLTARGRLPIVHLPDASILWKGNAVN